MSQDTLELLLLELQWLTYHEPDSDYFESCDGCGVYSTTIPPHKENCLVPRIAKVLKNSGRTKGAGDENITDPRLQGKYKNE